MPNDAYNLLEYLLVKYGHGKFDANEIKDENGAFTPAAVFLYSKDYIILGSLLPYAFVTKEGYLAYQEEALRRKDQAFAQAEKEAKEKENDRVHQQRADKLARKDSRRSWWQWGLRIVFDLLIFFLGVYLGGATKTFQWFVAIFH